mgnify:CR=1 FL=1
MNFFKKYYQDIANCVQRLDEHKINLIYKMIKNTSKKGGIIYIAGNGGNASTSSHMSTDLTKNAKIKSMSFNDANLITCFANDYGYENWVTEAIKTYSSKEDLIILISSSGTSKNIVKSAQYCKKNNINLITLSGFKKNNPLSQSGNINFHVESEEYNFIEMTHHIILLSIVDIFAKKIF